MSISPLSTLAHLHLKSWVSSSALLLNDWTHTRDKVEVKTSNYSTKLENISFHIMSSFMHPVNYIVFVLESLLNGHNIETGLCNHKCW